MMPDPGSQNAISRRHRITFAGLIVLVGLAGLATLGLRRQWPGAMDKTGGLLWATLAFLVVSFVWPRVCMGRRAMTALGIAFAVEFSQHYRAPWIDRIRGHFVGRLFLGMGFDGFDLISYTAGVLLGVGLCAIAFRRSVASSARTASTSAPAAR